MEVTADLALLAVHLSSLCEELILWSTREFGFASPADGHTAGSSLLPNKRNPDVLELSRGQAGAVVGDLVTLLTILKGLPLGYHRDFQADKAPAFHAIDSVGAALDILAEVVAHVEFDVDAMASRLGPSEAGVLLVEHLVAKGMAYRAAYELVKENLPAIAAAPDEEARRSALRKTSRLFEDDAVALLTPVGAVGAIVTHGGTGPAQLAAQMEDAEAALGRQAYHFNLIAKKNRRISEVLSGEAGP